MQYRTFLAALCCAAAVPLSAEEITVYSGRNENLIGPLIKKFEAESGITVNVRYGKTAEMAATLLEEGRRSPADVFLAQDSGALGAVSKAGLFAPLSRDVLERVDARFRSPKDDWVGLSGRARVVVYNTKKLKPSDLPAGIQGYTRPEWKNRIGWAPLNGSFQAFVTGLRKVEGDQSARAWLDAMKKNGARAYPKNTPIVEAVSKGEIDVGFVNHYYLFRFLKERGEQFPARNHFLPDGGPGALINVAGAAILKTSKNRSGAEKLLAYLLSGDGQRYFADTTFEYPLAKGVKANSLLPPLEKLKTPKINLGDLDDLQGTLKMLQGAGLL